MISDHYHTNKHHRHTFPPGYSNISENKYFTLLEGTWQKWKRQDQSLNDVFLCNYCYYLNDFCQKEFDCWQLSSPTASLYPSVPYLGSLIRKLDCALLWCWWNIQTMQAHRLYARTLPPPTALKYLTTPSHLLSLLSQTIFGSDWKHSSPFHKASLPE